ncbi:MAG TPA: type II secretion system protein GspG [Oligoflexia bacterium]|nr:type II secretion system protein GspG [Oligoflexia bacterium]HMR25556.1 type II secretion system protein GspG [Oligoflexia bacterium]
MKQNNKLKLYKKNSGFSLVELMAAVVIIALLSGLAGLGVSKMLKSSRIKAAQSEITTFSSALDIYDMECGGYPDTLQGLIEKPSSGCPGFPEGGFLNKKQIKLDPWGKEYQYEKNGVNNASGFDLWSMGPDKEDGTVDDITNWAGESIE